MDLTTLFSLWWVWLAFALGLGILEVLAPGFIFLGFCLAALVMTVLHLLLDMAVSLPAKFALFAGLSLLGWYVMRHFFKSPGGSVKTFEKDINDR
ncbi:MAG: hypothetical protein ABJI96_14345 [Paracoccaceae bacterium]